MLRFGGADSGYSIAAAAKNKPMFALLVGVAPAWIAGAQKPRPAKFQHILVSWFPAIHLCPLGMPG
ncbi:hypothetical protein A1356_07365 [Methylomonas koyamae]|uniref:Uncharacterized protein n=1 Tax=Methylomonas koyamae TaxID=702114 RepID=A0AA91DFH4_9GAMM|nr:hypothetical protein A1356_07365 [Methylomonas koyamae]